MKEIVAIIRPNQWTMTKRKMMEEGFDSYTAHRCYGRGRQKGLQYLSKSGKIEEGIRFLPKRMVTLIVDDVDADRAVKIIVEANQTGAIGDGKIFVSNIEQIERVRTGEQGELALL